MEWPNQDRFPTNRPQFTVHATIKDWFYSSEQLLLVTGYASLGKVIDLIASLSIDHQHVRIYLGNEPQPIMRERSVSTVADEMRDYWLAKGLSIAQCPRIEAAARRLRSRDVEVRMPSRGGRRVHAKLYCAIENVLLGSSNFTHAGLHSQIEGNTIFSRSRDKARYAETWSLAEAIWETGECCNDWLADLIEQLMKVVSWQEALARACSELLSGDWVDLLLSMEHESERLWPSQRDGIAQALYILDNTGAVLVADATGSGKTRMGAFLVQATAARARATGRVSSLCGIICPPSVIENWVNETDRPGPNTCVGSSGLLGRRSKDAKRIERILAQGDILVVDEAHNYHNLKSNRSQKLLESVATDLMLFTATPINRSARDLLVMINLLGADNLQEQTLKQLESYLGGRKRITNLDQTVIQQLSNEIRQFTVRRTISQLKAYIAAQPDAYKNALGENCTYPEINNKVYAIDGTKRDREIALQIAQLASQLKGLNYLLKPIKDDQRLGEVEPEALQRYVEWRVDAARFLAAYTVMHALRASKYVLMEVVLGHKTACSAARLKPDENHTERQGLIDRIRQKAYKMPVPAVDPAFLPDFLKNADSYHDAVTQELHLYEKIAAITAELSLEREKAKVRQILDASQRHHKLLVFEERILALRVIENLLKQAKPPHHVHLATGRDPKVKSKLCEIMGLGGREGKHIGLCSNAMAEGVNLQSASCLIMLDRPSVIRHAEQRIGRIERLDSPHQEAEIFWPLDAPAFRLNRDHKFISRHQETKRLIGANFEVPEEYEVDDFDTMTVDSSMELIAKLEQSRKERSIGMQDAFHTVRSLYDDGNDEALIPKALVDQMTASTGVVISRVSLVESKTHSPWAFICQAGTKHQPARWILVSEDERNTTAKLDEIVAFLKGNLGPDTRDIKPTDASISQMEKLVKTLRENPDITLSSNRLALLKLLSQYVDHMSHVAAKKQNQQQLDYYHAVKTMLPWATGGLLDEGNDNACLRQLECLADAFQVLLQPLRTERLKKMGNKKLVRYRDLLPQLKQSPLEFNVFKRATEQALRQPSCEPSTAAVIFGVM